MATQQDLQELIRLLTVGRKIPMMQAMAQIKALQGVNLRRFDNTASTLGDIYPQARQLCEYVSLIQ
jgi:hypothetical protein